MKEKGSKRITSSPLLISYYLSNKLLLEEEIPFPMKCHQTLISTHQLIPVKAIIQKGLSIQCIRCGNKKRTLFSTYPCSLCNQKHYYCRNCIQMGRISECKPLYRWNGTQMKHIYHKNPLTWDGELTQAQQVASTGLVKAIQRKEKEFLIWAVCGSGKTEMLFHAINYCLQQGKRIAIVSPRVDVIRELYPRIQSAFEKVPVEALYGSSVNKKGMTQIILATTHQLMRFKKAFDVLVIDEVDAFPFYYDDTLAYAAVHAKKPNATTVYLTATPRKDLQKRIRQRKLPHVFVPLRYHGYPLPEPTMKMTFRLQQYLSKKQIPPNFLKWLSMRKKPERQLLIFVPTVQLAKDLKEDLCIELLHHRTIKHQSEFQEVYAEDQRREEKVNTFREKKLQVLLTTTILERGVTFPSVDVAVLDAGHEVFDEASLVQIAGRAGRSADDPAGEVVYFHNGRTEAMEKSKQLIINMNKKGKKL
ncbi:DEAD/DEAH box helicase family protein [Oceanobacillus kimchii]|uniref:DEAD/DEAH box helicase n=1 Tax=Oceanobacillus kimchii TaxID=746691 RepID=UPI0021A8643A|nr:DEAD/DEAH box helicase family protein [Oceanobacillus kimchii]MCT1578038.1 DEAD/DEAH box helicase family protein [Oceanobacillus kimchii]MCT2137598.1 DEAD/DEAH box helicase family protein [Oceanobacillus kimchii]